MPRTSPIVLAAATALLLPAFALPVNAQQFTGAAIEAGGDHSCAVATGGGLKCWGSNHSGDLGDGTTADRNTPADVTGLVRGAAAVAAGGAHICALTTGGGVKCWGNNDEGQLGDGTYVDRATPVDVTGLASGVAAIAAGNSHTCALTTGGGVKCWGLNFVEQGGYVVPEDFITPTDVTGLAGNVVAIAAGGYHTCAITSGGAVRCWGFNYNGELGDGTQADRATPVDVTGLAGGVAALALGGHHSCALTTSGAMKCWGYNAYGQVGDGSMQLRTSPVDVTGLAGGVAAISAGWFQTCALTTSGAMKCWGYNAYGQVGDGTQVDRTTPVDVSGLSGGVAAISAGWSHTCALTTSAGVKCWGSNYDGQIGDNSNALRLTPVDVIDAGDTDQDGIPNSVESLEGTDPLVKDNDIFARARLFAMQQYRDFLGREGDAGGIQYYADRLDAGTLTRGNVVESFFDSPEFQAVGAPVARLYFACFLRIPDYVGLVYWTNYARAGGALAQVAAAFGAKAEFTNRYGALDNAQFVDQVYENVLGRPADPDGRSYWISQLNGGASRGSMMMSLSESPEFQSWIANEIYVTMMYVGLLRRAPDQGGFDGWVGYLDGGNPRQALIDGFLAAPEYHNRFLP